MTLFDSLEEIVRTQFPLYNNIAFLSGEKESADFIKYALKTKGYEFPSGDDYSVAQDRARHSAISFLLGELFSGFCSLIERINNLFSESYPYIDTKYLWMLTSLEHDYGYYFQGRNYPNMNEMIGKLFNDGPRDDASLFRDLVFEKKPTMTYSYSEMISYFDYRNEELKKNECNEKYEHGIWGGAKLFSDQQRRINKEKQTNKELVELKIVCLSIAQHNVYKSEKNTDSDYIERGLYRLISDSEFRIDESTPLLLLLSLVDTLECVKKFSRSANKNSNKYLETKTVLQSIDVSFELENKCLKWDISKLEKKIKEKSEQTLLEALVGYKRSISSLKQWTSFQIVELNDEFTITLCDIKEE